MTIILTQINKYGIVHGSDSNLTTDEGSAGMGKKVFQIPYLNAGLSTAGVYSVDGEPMDHWMLRFIAIQKSAVNPSLVNFAYDLKDALQSQMTSKEKEFGSLIHIAGYVTENERAHPEFWLVTNIPGFDHGTGEYSSSKDEFAATEDFWHRDCAKNNSQIAFESGGYQLYINGFASGRISYLVLQNELHQLFKHIWQNPSWKFRSPQTVEETEAFLRLYIQCVNTLFLCSDYRAPYIGGHIQTYCIPAPENTSLNCQRASPG
ncbi:MAG: hypothetical protein IT320_04505 [Anaerolineae bacterium]|nr:hypothetical protein [Anaerolineae bacterium]